MSTVLWANILRNDGNVQSEQADYAALHRHAKKLGQLSSAPGKKSFEDICDLTDARFNLEDIPLPDGMSSTEEWMARDGVWIAPAEAMVMLSGLIDRIRQEKTRFGLLSNQQQEVLEELESALAFVRQHADSARGFNFSVVM
jgi:hypothetical protein